MYYRKCCCMLFAVVMLCFTVSAQYNDMSLIHPRSVISQDDVLSVRQKIKWEPYKNSYIRFRRDLHLMEQKLDTLNTRTYDYSSAYLAFYYGCMFLFTDSVYYCDKAFMICNEVFRDSIVAQNRFSFGLSRAMILKNMALVYDFCFSGFDDDQRKIMLEGIFDLMSSVAAGMGYHANYALQSNWMGVRYSSIVIAASVWDDYGVLSGEYPRSRALPFLWDAINRLREHINLNITGNGWNTESLSYHGYNWSFIAPALMCIQKAYKSDVELPVFAPNALMSLHAQGTATISIRNTNDRGMQPDLSDDDPMTGSGLFALALPLYPQEQTPYIKWMFDYLFDTTISANHRGSLFYAIAFYPDTVKPMNPAGGGWLNYYDPEQGVLLFRNRFLDENDVLGCFNATAQRPQGHQGPDNLTFRIIGLGSLWAVGAGRTARAEGQTNLFPVTNLQGFSANNKTGQMLNYTFFGNGSGVGMASGSCLNVVNHIRYFEADYSNPDAVAVFIISDTSDNGKMWRLNTPEFNRFNYQPAGSCLRLQITLHAGLL